MNLVTYFDEHFASFLPSGHWGSTTFNSGFNSEGNKANGDKGGMRMTHVESDEGSTDSMPRLHSVSNTSDSEESDSEEGGPGSAIYSVSELTPLSTSPAWDDINASLNIRLTGANSLR